MNQKMKFTTLLYAGLRNKPGRNLATIFCFAFIAANIFSAQYLLAGTAMSVDQGITRMGADHLVVPAQYSNLFRGARSGVENTVAIIKVEPSTLRINADMVDKVSKIQGVKTVSPQVYVTTLNLSEFPSRPVDIFGIDPKSDFTIQPWLQHPLGHPLINGEILLGNDIPVKVGSNLSIGDHVYTVAGKLDPTQSSTDRTVFLRLDDAYALAGSDSIIPKSAQPLSPGLVNAVLVKVEPGADPDMVASRIQQPFAYSYITVVSRHFSLDPLSQDIQGLPKTPRYDIAPGYHRGISSDRPHCCNGCQRTPKGDRDIKIARCNKEIHFCSHRIRGTYSRDTWGYCRNFSQFHCSPWSGCFWFSQQCFPGFIPDAGHDRYRHHGRDGVTCRNYYRECSYVLSGLPEQHN